MQYAWLIAEHVLPSAEVYTLLRYVARAATSLSTASDAAAQNLASACNRDRVTCLEHIAWQLRFLGFHIAWFERRDGDTQSADSRVNTDVIMLVIGLPDAILRYVATACCSLPLPTTVNLCIDLLSTL